MIMDKTLIYHVSLSIVGGSLGLSGLSAILDGRRLSPHC